jgi:hypothetical protein|tara:strand:+ start:320 stop:580 length:261 start_codon:yes stop_codon:yes gene_type:complete
MKVKVYYESNSHAWSEEVATFNDEDTYIKCLPSLEAEAKKLRMIVTESLVEEEATPWFHKADKILSGGYWYAKITDLKLGSVNKYN